MLQTTHGAVLSQKQANNCHHPIGFMSESMNPAEGNYGILTKKLLLLSKGYRIGDIGSNIQNSPFKYSQTTKILNILQNLRFSTDNRCAGWSCLHTTTTRFITNPETRTAQLMLSPDTWNYISRTQSYSIVLHSRIVGLLLPTPFFDVPGTFLMTSGHSEVGQIFAQNHILLMMWDHPCIHWPWYQDSWSTKSDPCPAYPTASHLKSFCSPSLLWSLGSKWHVSVLLCIRKTWFWAKIWPTSEWLDVIRNVPGTSKNGVGSSKPTILLWSTME